VDIRHCRDKIHTNLTMMKFQPDKFVGTDAHNVLMLQSLNRSETRLSQLLIPGHCTPFELYLELCSLLAELMSLNPMNEIREIKAYTHDDCSPQFTAVINDIRSFISAEGGITYIRLNFAPEEGGRYLSVPLSVENIVKASEIYLAVRCTAEDRDVITALETGDTFKLINPSAKTIRIRGMKLQQIRYPPRFLPVISNTLWFKFLLTDSSRVWNDMCQEKKILIDWAHNLFPSLEASLFITMQEGN
jgi:predicted component of type VI protein secretion system